MIVGTAGHVDHGKTALVRALTGVDTDRLKEEKARGISIDLGFAYLPLESGEVLGFVDVPGHERFIHNMLAGATGVDFVLLVVAADDGPMPQTREHLQILNLLGLSRGAVALTKSDLVDAARLLAAQDEIRALLAGTALADAPILPVSATTGAGVDDLRTHLASAANEMVPRSAAGHFRLAIDRCFTLSGAGTVVTGTAFAGTAKVGDTMTLSPGGIGVRIRSIHAQNRAVETCRTGQRCALNLAGLDKDKVLRGAWIVDGALDAPTARFDAVLHLLPAEARNLRDQAQVHVHLGATHALGRVAVLDAKAVEPGGTVLAQVVLDRPIGALAGDRFIIRDASATRTIGGGRVLDPFAPARNRRKPERLDWLRARREGPGVALARAAGRATGVDLDRIAIAENLRSDELDGLVKQTNLHAVAGHVFTPARWRALGEGALAVLAAAHKRAPTDAGVDRERLRKLAAPALPVPVFDALLADLRSSGAVAVTGKWLHLPAFRPVIDPAEQRELERVLALLRETPLAPPGLHDTAKRLRLPEQKVRRLLAKLVRQGEVVAAGDDLHFTTGAIRTFAAAVKTDIEAAGETTVARLRDRLNVGRRRVAPLLDYLDRAGYTRRVGDAHVMRDAKALEK